MSTEPLKCTSCGAKIPHDPDNQAHVALQQALSAEIRCPACTPGFVNAAVAALPTARAGYQPIEVDVARWISMRFGKDVVVIVAWDEQSEHFHVTTYGRTAEFKQPAARIGEVCAEAVGAGGPTSPGRKTFEDFRHRTEAEWAAERERLSIRLGTLLLENKRLREELRIARQA